jgi:hypothetical protein
VPVATFGYDLASSNGESGRSGRVGVSAGEGTPPDGVRGAATSLAVLAFAAVVIGLAAAPLLHSKPTARQVRRALRAELQPVVLANCTLQRFGSTNVGGYLMCGNLLGNVESAYSYGIGPADDWGCDVSASLQVPVHQYDCFNPPESGCANGRSVFHDECIGSTREVVDSRLFDTLTHQVTRNGDRGKTLVVKIDVEGAELTSLMATPTSVLERIDQLAMEIHGTKRGFLELVRRLKRTFYLVHLHYNNQACSIGMHPMPAWAYQVLFVNKRIGVPDPSRPAAILPHPLDTPDYSLGRDCQVVE